MNEKISALIDAELDELDERRVLESVKNDPALRATWERYHLIRAAMTRQLTVLAPSDMPERVRSRLEAEQDTVKSLRFWPLAGGFAAAASIAVVAIFGLQTLRGPATPVAVAPVATVAVNSNAPAAASQADMSTPLPNPEDQLNFYLVGHNEFMPTGGMGNMLPYVRVVADNPDQ